jgi:hypothetical protein
MNIFNWFSNHKNDNTSAANKVEKITVEKVIDIVKTTERLEKFYVLIKHYVEFLLSTEDQTIAKIKEIQENTNQNLKDELLRKELWILRYAYLHVWFFDIRTPSNQKEVRENLTLINLVFQRILKDYGKADYFFWLKNGFVEYVGADELNFSNLKNFKTHISEKVAEKIPRIAFDCTEGRLAGELHDFVMELIMTTILEDKKVFLLDDDVSLTDEESQDIVNTINSMKPTEKDFENFTDALG